MQCHKINNCLVKRTSKHCNTHHPSTGGREPGLGRRGKALRWDEGESNW